MTFSLEESYEHCRQLARLARSSFSMSFFLLGREKRRAMFALYAFLRRTDDLGDSDEGAEVRRRALSAWRASLEAALGGAPDDPVLPALVDTVERYGIPHEYLFDTIDGVEMDLGSCRFETFADLEKYCYRVASVVGLSCIHIWGFSDKAAFEPARKCGLAFQLTNILRDVEEDAARDRIYLPLEDLRRFDYTPDDLQRSTCDERFTSLMQFEIDRAERFYDEAKPLAAYLTPEGRRTFRVMTATYRGLLAEITRRGGDVFSRPVRLSPWRKIRLAAGALLGLS